MSQDQLSPELQQKFNQLQMLEQNLQNFMMQKQMMQSQLLEIESALDEMKGSKENYKIVGNIMVLADDKKLNEELSEKKELLNTRVTSLESQESKLKEKLESIQKELMESMGEK